MHLPKYQTRDDEEVALTIIQTCEGMGLDPEEAQKMASRAVENRKKARLAQDAKAPS